MDTLEKRLRQVSEHADQAIDRARLTLSPRHLSIREIEDEVTQRAIKRLRQSQLVGAGALAHDPVPPESH